MKYSNPSLPDNLLLDNPVWHALSTQQSGLAQGNALAKRFPIDVAPFGGLIDQSPAAYEALEQIFPGAVTALALDAEPVLPADWEMVHSGTMYQIIDESPGVNQAEDNQLIRPLTKADVPRML